MATLRRSKFSTLRTTKLISKELEEYNRENNIYEQMSGYKRLRQQHQKELKQVIFAFRGTSGTKKMCRIHIIHNILVDLK